MEISKDRQLFQTNCINASKGFILFEKALPFDKVSTIDRIKQFQIPGKYAKHWQLVSILCQDFAEYPVININAYPVKKAFGISGEQQLITTSEQFTNLLEHIAKSDIKSINLEDFLIEHEKTRNVRLLCKTVISILERINTSVRKPNKRIRILNEFSRISQPEGLEYIYGFIHSILVDYVENERVNLSSYDFPDGISIPIPPYPVRGISGIIDILKSLATMETSTIGTSGNVCDTEKPLYNNTPPKKFVKPIANNCVDGSIVSNTANLATKEQILACYEQYISKLDTTISSIQAIRANNKKLERIQDDCLTAIVHLLDESKNQMNQVMTETVWDKLVIAFFGETNAGKSTIIEAFRCRFNDVEREESIKHNNGKGVDGLIVGDGRSDFTQVYEKYNLSINNEPFVLIDVPGIEGKEANYIEEISRALKQAHCVFYVQGHNVKPNAATAEKIKGFLSDWVNVYSIYNVRGGVSNYDEDEERETLMTKQKLEVQNSIEEVFRDILPNVYKGNVSLQGLLALLSVANFHETRQDLISNQNKIIHYFNGRENVLAFSHFDEIVKLIQEQSSNFGENILVANKNKLVSLSKRIQKGITSIIDEESGKLNSLSEQLISFRKSVKTFKSDICSIARSQMNNEANQALTALRSSMNDIIDDGSDVDEWSSRLNYQSNRISDILEGEIRKISIQSQEDFYRRIENKRKDLDKIAFTNFSLKSHDISINVDLSGVLDKLTLNFKNAMGGFLSGFFNPIGSLIKLFKNSEDGRKEAKQILGKEIDKIRPEIFSSIASTHYELEEKLKYDEKRLITSIESEISNIKQISKLLENLRKQFI